MKQMSKQVLAVALVAVLGAGGAMAQVAPQGQATPAADNTKMNNRDKGDPAQTPQTQSNAKADRELLASVRRAIVKDKSLSVAAHNVKILVEGGVVTLRGPVNSDAEKSTLESLAKSVAGVTSVDNKVDIKTN